MLVIEGVCDSNMSIDNFYRFIYEKSLDAILLTSPDGCVYRANQAAINMFQYTEEEMCRLGRCGLVDKSDLHLTPALEQRITQGYVRAELNYIRKNGEIFPGDTSSALFIDDEGRTRTILIIRDNSLYQEVKEQERRYAFIDYLTGIYNRRALIDSLEHEIARAKRSMKSLSLMLLDIDHLKRINDHCGHSCGDVVIKSFTKTLVDNLRLYDIVGRYGGDEFIVCLPETDYKTAIEIAERLRKLIEDTKVSYAQKSIKVTASIGVGSFDVNSNESCDALISRVDAYMYKAKGKRNKVYGKQKVR